MPSAIIRTSNMDTVEIVGACLCTITASSVILYSKNGAQGEILGVVPTSSIVEFVT